jgi:hypothetical protein
MKGRFFRNQVWVFAATIFLLPSSCFGQTAGEQIAGETARIEKTLASKPDGAEIWKDAKPDLTHLLAQVHESLAAGRTYLAIAELERASTEFGSAETATGNPEILKAGLPAFDEKWRGVDGDLKSLEKKYSRGNWTGTPAAVRAIAELDWIETRTLYRAARPYGDATQAVAGLYYLGESKASLEFALYCRSLHFPPPAPQPPVRSISAEIQRLEDRVLAAYQPPLSISRHTDFIRINSALKVAKELDEAQLYYGALFKYLDAAEAFGLLTAPPGDVQRADALRGQAAAIRSRVVAGAADNSLAQLFLERAERSLQILDAPHVQAALVRLEQVIPAYFAAISKAEPLTVAQGNPIAVTLVRWPYT